MLRRPMDGLEWKHYFEIIKKLAVLDRARFKSGELTRKTLNEPRFTRQLRHSEYTLEITKLLVDIQSLALGFDPIEISIDDKNSKDDDYYSESFFFEFFSVSLTLNPENTRKTIFEDNASDLNRYYKTPGAIFNDIGWDKENISCNKRGDKIPMLLAWYYFKLSSDKKQKEKLKELKAWHKGLKNKIDFSRELKVIAPHRIISKIDEIDLFLNEVSDNSIEPHPDYTVISDNLEGASKTPVSVANSNAPQQLNFLQVRIIKELIQHYIALHSSVYWGFTRLDNRRDRDLREFMREELKITGEKIHCIHVKVIDVLDEEQPNPYFSEHDRSLYFKERSAQICTDALHLFEKYGSLFNGEMTDFLSSILEFKENMDLIYLNIGSEIETLNLFLDGEVLEGDGIAPTIIIKHKWTELFTSQYCRIFLVDSELINSLNNAANVVDIQGFIESQSQLMPLGETLQRTVDFESVYPFELPLGANPVTDRHIPLNNVQYEFPEELYVVINHPLPDGPSLDSLIPF